MSRDTSPGGPPDAAGGRVRKAKGGGGARRQEILDHAQRLFAAHGVHSVSTRQISGAVGISQPTLYAYFARKADIMEEVSARAFREVSLVSMTAPRDGDDPLEAMIRAYIEFGLSQPDAYRIAFMIEGLHDASAEAALDVETARAAAQAFDTLRSVVADRLGPDDAELEVAAQSLWASMHGLVALLLARSGFAWVDRTRLIDRHVKTLARTLSAGRT